MSYRDELEAEYSKGGQHWHLNQWLDHIEAGNLSHADVMGLLAERDALSVDYGSGIEIDKTMRDNWLALFEEMQLNGSQGAVKLYAWWLGEQYVIEQSIMELTTLIDTEDSSAK